MTFSEQFCPSGHIVDKQELYTAMSTAVERLFSQGCQLLHFTCSCLSPSV
ncbi:hypothetical protein L208DRAFT_1266655 [Tricholoma matsutake]|nr:hypothetical protein L208DRAFT_1266655 [Tricholoma matsutake 945]